MRRGADQQSGAPSTSYCPPSHTPASSAPQRSQYHSVGRFKVPHSAHFKVLATPAAALLTLGVAAVCTAGSGALGAAVVATGDTIPGLLGRLPGRGSSSDTDLRKASSSLGTSESGSLRPRFGGAYRLGDSSTGSATLVTHGACSTGSDRGARGALAGADAGAAPLRGAVITAWIPVNRVISPPMLRRRFRSCSISRRLSSLTRRHSSSVYSPTEWRTSASASASSAARRWRSSSA